MGRETHSAASPARVRPLVSLADRKRIYAYENCCFGGARARTCVRSRRSCHVEQPVCSCQRVDQPGAAVVPGQELEPIRDGKIEKGETAYVDVTVATLWKDSKAPRKVDKPALGKPVDLDKWNENLKSTEVRRGLTGKAETQAVYGSEVTVLETKGNWAKVAVTDQSTPKNKKGYPGWPPTKRLVENDRFGKLKKDQPRAVVTAEKAKFEGIEFTKDVGADPSFNVELPLIAQDVEDVRVALPGGGARGSTSTTSTSSTSVRSRRSPPATTSSRPPSSSTASATCGPASPPTASTAPASPTPSTGRTASTSRATPATRPRSARRCRRRTSKPATCSSSRRVRAPSTTWVCTSAMGR